MIINMTPRSMSTEGLYTPTFAIPKNSWMEGNLEQMFLSILTWGGNFKQSGIENTVLKIF